jgi:hypothetical protein
MKALRLVNSPGNTHGNLQSMIFEPTHHYRILCPNRTVVHQDSRSLKSSSSHGNKTAIIKCTSKESLSNEEQPNLSAICGKLLGAVSKLGANVIIGKSRRNIKTNESSR